jgi:rhamnulokinase
VALVGGHDTASAIVGMGPASPGGSAFVASGTWMLAGVERPEPDTSEWARASNYTNEAGALGGTRFLRNVTGFWLLEQCRPHWPDLTIEQLVARAERVDVDVPVVDVDDERLRNPDDMLAEYTALAGLPCSEEPGLVARSIIESIAATTADVLAELETVATYDDVVLFGGAARMELLVQRLAERSGHSVRVGSAEAAALGNAIVQFVALDVFATIEEGRARVGSIAATEESATRR